MARDLAPILPATVQVRFAPYPCGDDNSYADIPADPYIELQLADLGLPTATGSGAAEGLRDSCHAVYPAPTGGDPSNLGVLQSLARLAARDLLGPRLVAYDRAYPGIVAPAPDATAAAIAWCYRADGASTRMATEPTGGEARRLGRSDPADDCDGRPLVYGGKDDAGVSNGTLTLGRVRLEIVDGALRFYRAKPKSVAICPSAAQPAGMTTEDGTGMTTE